jgi:hypothetical protein
MLAGLAGAGVGGAIGGLAGGLIGMGLPEVQAKSYEQHLASAGTLVSVHCDTAEERDLAKRILETTGARNIYASTEVKHSMAATEQTERAIPAKSSR